MKLKIVHIITDLDCGGAEHSLLRLCQEDKIFQHFVISMKANGELKSEFEKIGVPVLSLGFSKGLFSLTRLFRAIAMIRKLDPEILQGWMYHGNFLAVLFKFFLSRRSILSWNIRQSLYDLSKEKVLTALLIKLSSYLSRSADVIVYNSEKSQQQHNSLGYSPKNQVLIENGFDPSMFSKDFPLRKKARYNLNIPSEAMVIGHAARAHPMKNHRLFFEAARIILEKYSNVYILTCGKGVSSKILPWSNKELERRIIFLEETKDIKVFYNSLDIFCMTSSWGEGFSNSLAEAMLCEVPCIATNIGDSVKIVGEVGQIIPADSLKDLTEALKSWLDMPSVKREEIGKLAAQRINCKFNSKKMISRYDSTYIGLCSVGGIECAA